MFHTSVSSSALVDTGQLKDDDNYHDDSNNIKNVPHLYLSGWWLVIFKDYTRRVPDAGPSYGNDIQIPIVLVKLTTIAVSQPLV